MSNKKPDTAAYAQMPPLAKTHDENDVANFIERDHEKVSVLTKYTSIRNVGLIRDRDVVADNLIASSSVLLPGVMLTVHCYRDDEDKIVRRQATLSKDGAPGEIRVVEHKEPS